MTALETIRWLHVVSSALMFGVGVGAFWFMTTAVRSGAAEAIAITTRNAVRAGDGGEGDLILRHSIHRSP